MRNKWASCSTRRRLTFDESLLGLPGDLQDYVIVHELLHVNVPNHGKLWKSLTRAHLGDYEILESRLQRLAGKCTETHRRCTCGIVASTPCRRALAQPLQALKELHGLGDFEDGVIAAATLEGEVALVVALFQHT